MTMLSMLAMKPYLEVERRIKNHAGPLVWFILIAIVVYAFYCTSKGHSFGVIANPLKVGCYK